MDSMIERTLAGTNFRFAKAAAIVSLLESLVNITVPFFAQ
jgi:hypothetical protein